MSQVPGPPQPPSAFALPLAELAPRGRKSRKLKCFLYNAISRNLFEQQILVGGFNPSEKYSSKWESSPNRGEK